jgi:hypothetical protein
LTGQQRERLVRAIVQAFTLDQLNIVVQRVLGNSVQYYSIGPDLVTVTDQLLTALERENTPLFKLLLYLRETTNRVPLRAAIEDALALAPPGDPYQALVALSEPFVNRRMLREKLKQLFTNANDRTLIINGPTASGKSHSRWLVQHAARAAGIDVVYVRVSGMSLSDIVGELINGMGLPPQDFRDRLAQVSTLGRGFVSALRGYSRIFGQRGDRWCIVFDQYDPAKLGEGVEEMVEQLAEDAANVNLNNVWVIVLGNSKTATALPWRVLQETVTPLTRSDVDRFLEQLGEQCGRPLPPADRMKSVDAIFGALIPPLDHDGMSSMTTRLRQEIDKQGLSI